MFMLGFLFLFHSFGNLKDDRLEAKQFHRLTRHHISFLNVELYDLPVFAGILLIVHLHRRLTLHVGVAEASTPHCYGSVLCHFETGIHSLLVELCERLPPVTRMGSSIQIKDFLFLFNNWRRKKYLKFKGTYNCAFLEWLWYEKV